MENNEHNRTSSPGGFQNNDADMIADAKRKVKMEHRSRSRSPIDEFKNRENGRSKSRSNTPKDKKKHKHRRTLSRSRSRSRSRSHRSMSPKRHQRSSDSHSRNDHSHRNSYRSRSRSRDKHNRRSYSPTFHDHSGSDYYGNKESASPNRCLGAFGIGFFTDEKLLRNYFSQFGDVDEVLVIRDRSTGRSRGYAFIYFRHVKDAIYAREKANGWDIDGRKVRIEYSVTKGPRQSYRDRSSHAYEREKRGPRTPPYPHPGYDASHY